MTVVEVEVLPLRVPLHTPFVTALRRTTEIAAVGVRLCDDQGHQGWGEAPGVWRVTGESPASAEACLDGPLRSVLTGASLCDPADLCRRLQRCVVANHGAKAAADVAVHDLLARRAGVPLAQLLAGRPMPLRVPTDVTLAAGDGAALVEAARDRVSEGFTAVKLKVGTDADTDVDRVRRVRAAVGPDVSLRLDANQGWRADEAVRVIRDLEDAGADVALVEQPVAADDLDGLEHVTARVATPVMADEAVFGLRDLVEVVRRHAVDLVNVKLAKCGGLSPARELLEIARRHGVGTMVGSMMETQLGVSAAASLVAAGATSLTADLDAAWWTTQSPYRGGMRYDGPVVELADEPGLGITGLR